MRLPRLRGRQGDAARRLDLAALALEDGDPRKALDLAGSALREARRGGAESEVLEALLLRAASLFELERFAEARKEAAQACEADPENPAAWFERAEAAYRCADFEEALSAVRTAVDLDPEDPEAWSLLGRVALWMDDAAAAELGGRAPIIDRRWLGGRFGAATLATLLSTGSLMSCFALLPFWLENAHGASAAVAGVAFLPIGAGIALTSRRSGRLGDAGRTAETTAAGMLIAACGFLGTALADDWPERIVLFQRNHENVCGSLGALREEIRRTVLHEVGHHFGMDEHELPY
ncbi:MAG: tetratricopeptide repeat protein [Chloroflexi bacterium]|nr:MAG: tetratricopeptide repeat protein [Chloroflexota bacterium]